jgi:hypothetical protein
MIGDEATLSDFDTGSARFWAATADREGLSAAGLRGSGGGLQFYMEMDAAMVFSSGDCS